MYGDVVRVGRVEGEVYVNPSRCPCPWGCVAAGWSLCVGVSFIGKL